MDLLATVKKSGSRGGTGDFKWSDVQTSSHREHYLGHSLMAPVGRWQKGRDLNWYARGEPETADEFETAEEKAARQRADEIRAIKDAEQDAFARALGLPVPDRSNPNTQALGNRRDVERAIKEAATDDGRGGKGLGFGSLHHGQREGASEEVERLEGDGISEGEEAAREAQTWIEDIIIKVEMETGNDAAITMGGDARDHTQLRGTRL